MNVDKKALMGKFNELDDERKEFIRKITANFHYRDGEIYPDGSMGTIRITLRELSDCIAYAIIMNNDLG